MGPTRAGAKPGEPVQRDVVLHDSMAGAYIAAFPVRIDLAGVVALISEPNPALATHAAVYVSPGRCKAHAGHTC